MNIFWVWIWCGLWSMVSSKKEGFLNAFKSFTAGFLLAWFFSRFLSYRLDLTLSIDTTIELFIFFIMGVYQEQIIEAMKNLAPTIIKSTKFAFTKKENQNEGTK